MIYIITFYSHFTAMSFAKEFKKRNKIVRLMPVPRILSSSCGTCVRLESDEPYEDYSFDGIEKVFFLQDNSYRELYRSRG